ncbi:hypothetical protein B0O99DRAFT_682062 [Bisporella sp. PMI_857]|nr:hypothetical protein B0O99DRAFT_682932 [Bisporella sp. PMI_857]KAH8600376.1 hypothetical protein B0O99DRAFT_682062 [Bisporella sp. PMI_857]
MSEASPAPQVAGPVTPTEPPKLSGAELKKLQKEEKAKRRAQEKLQKGAGGAIPSAGHAPKPSQSKSEQQKKTGPLGGDTKHIPSRQSQKQIPTSAPKIPKEEDKTVEFFRHLNRPRKTANSDAGKEVHPAVLTVGLQIANYTICGSCARLVATLQALKEVIASYRTPPGNTLSRHLTSHVLSPNIDYIASCRPISISMGNAIRWLKLEISKVDIDIPDSESKASLCDSIDIYIRDRVTVADQIIVKDAAEKIKDGDVILTYGKSSLFETFTRGATSRNFTQRIGLEVKYCLINGLIHNIRDATKVFLGAHAMMSNGRLFSRVGTAVVAMEARVADIPVLVLCETIKFTERVALDSIVHNEVAPADELVIPGPLESWKKVKGLQLLNLMYDVTPAEYIHIVITEYGSLPPTSVPSLYRVVNETE